MVLRNRELLARNDDDDDDLSQTLNLTLCIYHILYVTDFEFDFDVRLGVPV